MRKINDVHIYILFVLLLIFGLFQLSIFRLYGFSLYPDEFGYWSSAANIVGYDWSTLASLGSYYSFGYSLLLMPILYIFKGGLAAYRAAIGVNYLLVALSFVLLSKLSLRIFGGKSDRIKNVLICAVASLYPPLILYSQMTMAESLVTFLFILLCYIFAEYLYKPDVIKLVLLVIVALYLYSVHNRTIGVIIALFLAYVFFGIANKKSRKLTFIMICLAVGAVLIFIILRHRTIGSVFAGASADDLDINGYRGQVYKIKHILSKDGIGDFAIEVLGKLYYLVISTYGMVVFCLISVYNGLRDMLKGKPGSGRSAIFKLFVVLSTVAEILISSIFLHLSDRADVLFYGRYDEFVAPVLIVMGMYEAYRLLKRGRIDRFIIISISTALVLMAPAFLFIRYLKDKEFPSARGFFISGIFYLNGFNEYEPSLMVWRAILTGVVLILVVFVSIWISVRIKGGMFLLGLMVVSQILLGYKLSDQWTYRINSYVYTNKVLLDEFKDHPDKTLYYLDIDDNYYVDYIQFEMPKREFKVVTEADLDTIDLKDAYLIVNWSYPGLDDIKNRYEDYIESDMMFAFYEE